MNGFDAVAAVQVCQNVQRIAPAHDQAGAALGQRIVQLCEGVHQEVELAPRMFRQGP